MKFKTAHAKVLSLLLTLVMVLSTAAVFAEGEENVATGDTTVTAQEEQSVETAEEEAVEADAVLDVQDEAEFSIVPVSDSVEAKKSVDITVNNQPADSTIAWVSSDENAATVSDGKVTAGDVSAETVVTITAKAMASDGETVLAEATCTVTVTPVVKPAKPTNVKATLRHGKGDNGLTISWSGDADSFIVMRGTSAGNMSKYKTTTAKSVYWLEAKGTYYYAVKAVKGGVESDPSDTVSASITGNILPTIQELTWYSHTKKKVTLYRTAKLKGKVATLPKGTYVQAIGKSPKKVKKFKQPSKVQVRAKVGGKTVVGWVKYKQLKGGVKAATTVSQDFTPSALEDFVNEHGYSSPNKYLIWVSPRTQRAYLFTGKKGSWKLSDRFRVTTGRFSHKTAPYHSAISKKKAKVWMVTEKGKRYYYKTASYFASGVSFHTGTWWANGKVRGVMNKNGVPQTFGCLRMANSEAGWIYNHVPVGTTVIVKKDAA